MLLPTQTLASSSRFEGSYRCDCVDSSRLFVISNANVRLLVIPL